MRAQAWWQIMTESDRDEKVNSRSGRGFFIFYLLSHNLSCGHTPMYEHDKNSPLDSGQGITFNTGVKAQNTTKHLAVRMEMLPYQYHTLDPVPCIYWRGRGFVFNLYHLGSEPSRRSNQVPSRIKRRWPRRKIPPQLSVAGRRIWPKMPTFFPIVALCYHPLSKRSHEILSWPMTWKTTLHGNNCFKNHSHINFLSKSNWSQDKKRSRVKPLIMICFTPTKV